jgi:uncharacterized protein (DUF924 family)
MPDWVQEVLGFWFSLRPEQYWKADDQLDREISERFQALWEDQRQFPASTFLSSADEALASVILFDQFPRNMFRGHADSYATDHLALEIAKKAIDQGYDDRMIPERRGFLYMPFQHSEKLDEQQRSVLLFTSLGDAEQLRFAKLHHDVVDRFGRFPHRNKILGRTPREDEIAAGDVFPW